MRQRPSAFGTTQPRVSLRDIVYFIGSVHTGPIKIGRTASLPERLSMLQTGHPYELVPLAVIPGDAETEEVMHKLCAAHHIRGEWFHPHAEILRTLMLAHRKQAQRGFSPHGGDPLDPEEWLSRCERLVSEIDKVQWESAADQRRGLRVVLHGMWANAQPESIALAYAVIEGRVADWRVDTTEYSDAERSIAWRALQPSSRVVPGMVSPAVLDFLNVASIADVMTFGVSESMARKLLAARQSSGGTMVADPARRRVG